MEIHRQYLIMDENSIETIFHWNNDSLIVNSNDCTKMCNLILKPFKHIFISINSHAYKKQQRS